MSPAKPIEIGKPASPMRIVVPALVLMLLFVLIAFRGALPLVEERMLSQKKEMVRELIRAAMPILVHYHELERQGVLTRREAQIRAAQLLKSMRYGPEAKDYFWINDFSPKLIMHPYREDLLGQNVADWADPSGKYLFRDFIRIARENGGGYVEYMWQWKDDPERIVPKISYIETFKTWNWIVGTGVYIEDVRAEIAALSRRLALLSGALLLLIVGFSGYYVWQWAETEKRRRAAWRELNESREKYMAVLESCPNAVVVYDHRGRVLYFNPAFSCIFGWKLPELEGRRIE
jgi:signal transduction histidine kinase